jgi:hypothetical protein
MPPRRDEIGANLSPFPTINHHATTKSTENRGELWRIEGRAKRREKKKKKKKGRERKKSCKKKKTLNRAGQK